MTTPARELRVSNGRGQQLAASFQPAAGGALAPAVLLCQGLSGIRTLVLPEVAQALSAAGICSLRFDYSGFGDSEGDRGWIDPAARLADARSALELLAGQPEVDASRIGVYGHSYGGPVAIMLGAESAQVRALAAVSSPGSGVDMLRAARPAWEWVALKQRLSEEHARIDQGEQPEIVGIDTIFPFSPKFAAGYAKLKQTQGGTSALQGAEGLGKDHFYLSSVELMAEVQLRPAAQRLAHCAALFISGELDDTAPIENLEPVYEAIPGVKEWIVLAEADHNDLDSDPGLRAALASVTDWFRAHL